MTEDNVVPDPKSGRDSSPQNPDAVEQYILSLDAARRTNELKQVRKHLSKVRITMSSLQDEASRNKRKYDFVPEDIRRGLKACRAEHRVLIRVLRAYESVIQKLEEEE